MPSVRVCVCVCVCGREVGDGRRLIQLHNALVISSYHLVPKFIPQQQKLDLSALNAVHHAETRIATRGFRSSPIQILLGDAGVLRLELIRQSHIVKYWVRARILPYRVHFHTLLFLITIILIF